MNNQMMMCGVKSVIKTELPLFKFMNDIITITQTDIDNGIENVVDKGVEQLHEFCPAAIALQRHFNKRVLVGWNGISLEDYTVLIPIPTALGKFIASFDAGDYVLP